MVSPPFARQNDLRPLNCSQTRFRSKTKKFFKQSSGHVLWRATPGGDVLEAADVVYSIVNNSMNEMIRRPADFSPKSSPRGSRSPVVPRQDSTGTLKTTISLGKTPAIVHSGPFYLMKAEPPSKLLTCLHSSGI